MRHIRVILPLFHAACNRRRMQVTDRELPNTEEDGVSMMELMTAASVAKRTGVTPATVRAWADRGVLPAQRTTSGVRLFDSRDVERLARERDALTADAVSA